MKFMNDWIGLALTFGFLCGGMVAGRRFGTVAAWWLAGGCWLAFRLADAMWRPALARLRSGDPELNVAAWIPLTYGMLFAAVLLPTVVWMLLVRPGRDVVLPGKSDTWLSMAGGLAAGGVLLLALTQAHVMHPVIRERMPETMGLAEPLLKGLGQQHTGPGGEAGPPGARREPS